MSDLFWLTDAQMARLAPFFPRSHGKPRVDDRRVLSGIIFINRNGLRWRDAPAAKERHVGTHADLDLSDVAAPQHLGAAARGQGQGVSGGHFHGRGVAALL